MLGCAKSRQLAAWCVPHVSNPGWKSLSRSMLTPKIFFALRAITNGAKEGRFALRAITKGAKETLFALRAITTGAKEGFSVRSAPSEYANLC